jgi:hypothetical protein
VSETGTVHIAGNGSADRLLTDAEVAEFLNVPASWDGPLSV